MDFGSLIDNAETLIVDCSKMSKDKMILLGTFVTQGICDYFRFSEKETYNPLALYIDECQNFVNSNFSDILKEGRKYNISATLATQSTANIDKDLRQTLFEHSKPNRL